MRIGLLLGSGDVALGTSEDLTALIVVDIFIIMVMIKMFVCRNIPAVIEIYLLLLL